MAKSSRGKSKTKSSKHPRRRWSPRRRPRARQEVRLLLRQRPRDGRAEMKNLLGGKGANLAEMAGLGLPVPPGFTISTDVCTYYYDNRRTYPRAQEAGRGAHGPHREHRRPSLR